MLEQKQKVFFNLNDEQHIKLFRSFLKNSKWGKDGCPFELEEPWRSIPDMIKDKLSRNFVGLQ